MKLAIGCDEAAYDLKEVVREHASSLGHEVTDFGTFDGKAVLYPDIGFKVAEAVAQGLFERGILLCGTGIGMAISANKVPGIRAAQCHDTYSAERASLSNDAQIITIGGRVVGSELAKSIVEHWLNCRFAGGQSSRKLERIHAYETEVNRR